jgi:2-methylcitrate dehydratase PrpD
MPSTTIELVSHRICAWRPQDVPDAALDQAAWCILDLLGAAMAGWGQGSARAARRFAGRFFPSGPAAVWFSPERLSAPGAAFCNAAAASALDLDDGHRAAGGHPGAALVPAAIAVAQTRQSSGRDVLAALAIGYETAVRAAAARHPSTLDTFSTGRWCGYGAAAIRCWLEDRGAEVLAHAMAISGIHAPLQSASAYSRFGHHTKEGIPWGTLTGLAAVDLAADGFAGPLDIWDHDDYYRPQAILQGFGDDWSIIRTYFKAYACCRWLHAALDAWQDLIGQGLCAEETQRVDVFTFQRAVDLNNLPDPGTLEQAQFSLPFCLAVLALKGPHALLPLSADLLGRPELEGFARNVHLHPDAAMESEFPACTGARLMVRTASRTFATGVLHPRGDPGNPLSSGGLLAKFHQLAGAHADRPRAEAVVQAVLQLKHAGIEELSAALQELADDES